MKYMITGGGSGGHIYPALAAAAEIKRNDPDSKILYVGVKSKVDLIKNKTTTFDIKFIRSSGLPRNPFTYAFIRFLINRL